MERIQIGMFSRVKCHKTGLMRYEGKRYRPWKVPIDIGECQDERFFESFEKFSAWAHPSCLLLCRWPQELGLNVSLQTFHFFLYLSLSFCPLSIHLAFPSMFVCLVFLSLSLCYVSFTYVIYICFCESFFFLHRRVCNFNCSFHLFSSFHSYFNVQCSSSLCQFIFKWALTDALCEGFLTTQTTKCVL